MAAPHTVTISNLSGKWMPDKARSNDLNPGLKLQGLNWALRKIITGSNPTTDIRMWTETETKSGESATYFTGTMSVAGAHISSTRILDGRDSCHSDLIFGSVRRSTHFVKGVSLGDGKGVVPDIGPQNIRVQNETAHAFLRGEILPDGCQSDGFLLDDTENGQGRVQWVYTVDEQSNGDWITEQVWGFELIDGGRYHTRRIVFVNKQGHYEMARVVCLFLA